MFERPRGGERAVLVHLLLDGFEDERDCTEFRELAVSAGAECAALITGRRQTPDPRLFVGSGKAGEIREAARQSGAELIIFDHDLSPGQERNLEAFLQCRVDALASSGTARTYGQARVVLHRAVAADPAASPTWTGAA